MPHDDKPEKPLVATIGNGIMGHGIAEVFATAGHDVVLIGRSHESLQVAIGKIAASVDEFVARGLLREGSTKDALARIKIETSLESAKDAGLVIEALPENLELKVETFGRLDEICSATAILATASGHPVSEMSSRVSGLDRVIATHFIRLNYSPSSRCAACLARAHRWSNAHAACCEAPARAQS